MNIAQRGDDDVKNVNPEERFLVPLVQRYYKEEKLNLIIDGDLKKYVNSYSMKVFSNIAFQCLHHDRNQRPSMDLVLQRLEEALKLLEFEKSPELLREFKEWEPQYLSPGYSVEFSGIWIFSGAVGFNQVDPDDMEDIHELSSC
ncbi:hypothetical protein L1987_80878 [Smallanthus sonchifolius]|uniref:Uncharacterized protein n=1 Tax=Smallanthus sonchifolius TaxID=185202 RepID=A0ACB8YNW6_9ASTR|nr:hypothetical protein L1987_80878 [Smallanthus sonchifolius]